MIPNGPTGPGDPIGLRLRYVLLGGARDGLFIIVLMLIIKACS